MTPSSMARRLRWQQVRPAVVRAVGREAAPAGHELTPDQPVHQLHGAGVAALFKAAEPVTVASP